MRYMYDSITPERIPSDAYMVASYVDGNWPNYSKLATLFPDAIHVSIAVFADAIADVLDVERGNATIQQTPGWVTRMRSLGRIPTVYCSESLLPDMVAEFQRQNVQVPLWWIANYDNPGILIPGSIATQFKDDTPDGWDISVVADYWPGVDDPIVIETEEDEMKPYIVAYQGSQWVVKPDLSGRTGIVSGADLQSLASTNQYITNCHLSDAQMAKIPVTQ